MGCLPSFLVIGTQKGGTSSMNGLLKSLANTQKRFLHLPHRGKELNLFSERFLYWLSWRNSSFDSVEGFEDETHPGNWWIPKKTLNLEDLLRWYKNQWEADDLLQDLTCSDRLSIKGEVSPNYMSHPLAPFIAHLIVPKVKIVLILRDPVDRLLSAYNMKWQIRVCNPGAAWKGQSCFEELIANNNTADEYNLAKEWIAGLIESVQIEIFSIEDCLVYTKTSSLEINLKQFPLSRWSCVYQPGVFDQEKMTDQFTYKLYEELEDFSFLRRSLYVSHLLLWDKFYNFKDRNNLLILSSTDFEQNTESVINRLHMFMEISPPNLSTTDLTMKRHVRSYIITDELLEKYPDLKESYQKMMKTICEFMEPWNADLFQFLLQINQQEARSTLINHFAACQ